MSENQGMKIISQRAPIHPADWGPSASSSLGKADWEAATQLLDLLFAQHGQPDDN